jgi:hypothetical protein
MKSIIASSPFVGHLNPLLQIAGLLRARGHEIIVHTVTALRDRATGLDARFVPFHGSANFDSRDMAGVFPEHECGHQSGDRQSAPSVDPRGRPAGCWTSRGSGHGRKRSRRNSPGTRPRTKS